MQWSPKGHQALLSQCASVWPPSSLQSLWAPGTPRDNPSAAIERLQNHLEVATSEVNGLIAGLHFQDQAEGGSKAVYDYPSELSDDDLDLQTSYPEPQEPEAEMRDQPNAPQWEALRAFRQESEFHHARFRRMERELKNPAISGLLKLYPDAQGIRNTGAQLVKDVLDGFRPEKLSEVFVFTCFAYAISQVLHKRDRLDKIHILADIRAWRALIRDKDEVLAFNMLAPRLWPESKQHCHFPDATTTTASSCTLVTSVAPIRTGHETNAWPSSGATTAPQYRPFDPVQQQGTAIEPFSSSSSSSNNNNSNGSRQPGILGPDFALNTGGTIDAESMALLDTISLMNYSHKEVNFADTSWMSLDPLEAALLSAGPPPQISENPDALDPGGEKKQLFSAYKRPEDAKLVETVMFLIVFAFLQDIGEQFLHILSGRTLSSGRQKLFSTQKGDQEVLCKEASKSFSRLRTQNPNSKSSAFRALISVAEMLTREGHLRSFDEIKHYLIALATVSSTPSLHSPKSSLAASFFFCSLNRRLKQTARPLSRQDPILRASSWPSLLGSSTPTGLGSGNGPRMTSRPHLSGPEAKRPSTGPLLPSPPPNPSFISNSLMCSKLLLTSRQKKRQRRTCKVDGCDKSYSDGGGLRKHMMQFHSKSGATVVICEICRYESVRPDRVRAHFLAMHPGIPLPESLQFQGRTFRGGN